MENIVRLKANNLDDFLKSLTICFPGDYVKREEWIELLEDEKTLIFTIKENDIIKANIAIYNWKMICIYLKVKLENQT